MVKGRKRNSAQKQSLANTRPDKRHAVASLTDIKAFDPISGPPPKNLKHDGIMLWNLICHEQASMVAHGHKPVATMQNYADIHQYCLTYDRLQVFSEAIDNLTSRAKTPQGRMTEKNRNGELGLKKLFFDEMKLRQSFIAMGNAIGLSKAATNVAVQINNLTSEPKSEYDDLIATNAIVVESE